MSAKEKPFIEAIQKKFVTLPGEQLIFVERKHWSAFGIPIIILGFMSTVILAVFSTGFQFFQNYIILLLSAFSVIFIFMVSLALRSIIDWYFNVYVVTSRKIIEVSYSPLSSHTINQVLLDQVRCTEIDTKIEGILNDVLDIGNVVITFDRPTHQEEFAFEYVKNPREIEKYLQSTVCHDMFTRNSFGQVQQFEKRDDVVAIYNKSQKSGKWTYVEDAGNMLEHGVAWNI